MAIVGIAGMPGKSIDARIASDVQWLIKKFKIKVTDGYAPSGHAPNGEHPEGLAIDFIPDVAKGGTWDDVDAAVAWAKKQDRFRWIGYDGVAGHGRGNHAHFSWKAPPKGGFPSLGDVGDVIDGATDAVGGVVDAAGDPVSAVLGGLWDWIGKGAGKVALLLALVIGGLFLVVRGSARATGTAPSGAVA